MLILQVLQGPDKGRVFELPDNEPQLIGRSSEALPLMDSTISRRHAELTPDDGRWYIRDLESANGTYVNAVPIAERTLLKRGDQIRTGSTLFVYGQSATTKAERSVNMLQNDRMSAAVEKTIASSDDSVILAVPEPNAEAVSQLGVIYELMQLVGSTFDRQVLLDRVMDLVCEYFKIDRGFILMMSSADDEPEPVVIRYRRKPRTRDERQISVSQTIVKHVFKKGEGVLSSNAMTDKRFSAGDSVRAFNIRSAICVPIKFRDRVFGVIHIDSQTANYTYTEDQLRLMTAIGAQTGLALSNAELYQQGLQKARLAAVGETVASISHSIRNILQGMRGGAEVIELGMRKRDLNVVTNGWPILRRNLDRIYNLTMNMLAYSKQRKPEIESVDLIELLNEIVILVQPQFDSRNVALLTEIEGQKIPPVPADPSGLHQAIMNLVTNAMDAVDQGNGVVTLRCVHDPIRHIVQIVVSDNGQGIAQDQIRRIFQPFHSTKGQRGTGLGLAVTRKIVYEHQGQIHVKSLPDEGATFIISLPLKHQSDPSETSTANDFDV